MELLKTLPGFRIRKSSVPSFLKNTQDSPSSDFDVAFLANARYSRPGTHHEKSLLQSRFSAGVRTNPRSILKRQCSSASREFISKPTTIKFPNIVKSKENNTTISSADIDSKSRSVEESIGVRDDLNKKQKTEKKVVTFHLGNREKKARLAHQLGNQWTVEISSKMKPISAKKKIIFLDSRYVSLRHRPNTEQLPKRSSRELTCHRNGFDFPKVNSRAGSSHSIIRSHDNIFQSMAEDYRKMWNNRRVLGESLTPDTYGSYENMNREYKTTI